MGREETGGGWRTVLTLASCVMGTRLVRVVVLLEMGWKAVLTTAEGLGKIVANTKMDICRSESCQPTKLRNLNQLDQMYLKDQVRARILVFVLMTPRQRCNTARRQRNGVEKLGRELSAAD